MMFNVDRPQKVGSPCAIYQPHSKTSASRSSKPAVYEHMTETAPSCKTYLPTTRLHNTSQETPNPSIQPLRHPTRDSRNGVRPTLPTIINHSSVHSSAASPLPPRSRQPTGLPACLPPDQRWSPHNNWFPARRTWLSYRATPRFQRGHSKVAGNLPHRLPRAGLLAELPCSYQLLAWTHTSVGGKGRRTRAPPSQVETLPGAHKSGNLPSQHTRTQHLLGHVNTGHNDNCSYYQQACW